MIKTKSLFVMLKEKLDPTTCWFYCYLRVVKEFKKCYSLHSVEVNGEFVSDDVRQLKDFQKL